MNENEILLILNLQNLQNSSSLSNSTIIMAAVNEADSLNTVNAVVKVKICENEIFVNFEFTESAELLKFIKFIKFNDCNDCS